MQTIQQHHYLLRKHISFFVEVVMIIVFVVVDETKLHNFLDYAILT
jgi:hypothetical protein